MKKFIVVALLCVNAALLAALALAGNAPAHGQAIMQNDYMMVSGRTGSDYDSVYVLDLGKQKLCALRIDKTSKKFVWFPAHDLKPDFKRQ